ncbi:MAG: aspartyl protease family protein [Flavobacteriaceae bacterium]
MLKKQLLTLLTFFILTNLHSQSNFRLINNIKKETVKFKLINNLIIIPVKINGKDLNFLLDTGVSHSILFNVSANDSLKLRDAKKIKIKGLGNGKQFNAYESKNNLFRLKNIVSPNFRLLIILDEEFDFSSRLGIDVHGIIGSDLFENFTVKVNYSYRKLEFYNPDLYVYEKCKKCQDFPLVFQGKKPYIHSLISSKDKMTPVKLLIDSGSSDSIWLHEESKDEIQIPDKFYKDFLGKGLSGNIFGKKAKLKKLEIGSFNFENMIAVYPDSSSFNYNNLKYKRDGVLGGEILKRFHIIYDYKHKKVTFKKNRKYYKSIFYYDKSGMDIIHDGKVLIKKYNPKIIVKTNSVGSVTEEVAMYNYSFENSFIISNIKKDSPAYKAGLKEGDVIIKLNYNAVYNLNLQELNSKLSGNEGKRIHLKVERNGVVLKFKFKLIDFL